MPRPIDDPKHWRTCADEARRHAKQMSDDETKRVMLEIAASYDRLAEHTEARLAAQRERSPDS
jgi:hypothetical protein